MTNITCDHGTRNTDTGHIEPALNALIPIPSLDELKTADEDRLLRILDWLCKWVREIDHELKIRYADQLKST